MAAKLQDCLLEKIYSKEIQTIFSSPLWEYNPNEKIIRRGGVGFGWSEEQLNHLKYSYLKALHKNKVSFNLIRDTSILVSLPRRTELGIHETREDNLSGHDPLSQARDILNLALTSSYKKDISMAIEILANTYRSQIPGMIYSDARNLAEEDLESLKNEHAKNKIGRLGEMIRDQQENTNKGSAR